MNWLEDLRKQGEDWRRKVRGEGEKCGTGIGPGGKDICPTPGMRIRSKGRGRGLASGKGRGPLSIPYKNK